MKVIVFSDSHRSMYGMKRTLEQEKPDLVLHLGDHIQDAEQLSELYPKLALVSVPGNCDGWRMEPMQRELELEGHKLLMSHGHLWQVKSGYDAAIWKARGIGAELLLFGHTHEAYCAFQDGLWILNPGSARRSYGRIDLTVDTVRCTLHEIPSIHVNGT